MSTALKTYNVYLGRKLIDTIFMDGKRDNEDVKRSLIDHDGYDPSIRVVTPRRKMETEYEIQGDYGNGFEYVETCSTSKEAKDDLKAYRLNDPRPYRCTRRRVPVNAQG